MKNSAWYYRLWYKKLDKLPLKTDADASWLAMQRMLDLNLPVEGNLTSPANKPGGVKIPKPLGNKIVSLLGYGLPTAAMIGAAVYFTSPKPAEKAVPSPAKNENHVGLKQSNSSVIAADTLLFSDLHLRDSLEKLAADSSKVTIHAAHKSIEDSDNEGIDVSGKNAAVTAGNSVGSAKHLSISRKASRGNIIQEQQHQQQSHQSERIRPGNDKAVSPDAIVEKERSANINLNNQVVQTKANTTGEKGNPQSFQVENNIVETEAKLKNSLTTQNKNFQSLIRDKQMLKDKKTAALTKTDKAKKTSKTTVAKEQSHSPSAFSYGLNGGLNVYSQGSGIYLGVFGDYKLNDRLMFGAGLRINSGRTLSDSYIHTSFLLKDALPEYNVDDTRKLLVLDLPLAISYKITRFVSIKAGPVLSIVAKQTNVNTKFSAIISNRDTTYKGVIVDETMPQSTVNKISLGFSGGISFHLKKFDLEAGYQMQGPFKVKNELGTYQRPAHTFRLGIGYRFK